MRMFTHQVSGKKGGRVKHNFSRRCFWAAHVPVVSLPFLLFWAEMVIWEVGGMQWMDGFNEL